MKTPFLPEVTHRIKAVLSRLLPGARRADCRGMGQGGCFRSAAELQDSTFSQCSGSVLKATLGLGGSGLSNGHPHGEAS
jgi:hypothetical protein